MRLNDPQIELVHDDPFMGYIETAPATRSGASGTTSPSSHRRRAPLDSITDEVVDDADEDVDVGEETSRPTPPPPPPPSTSSSSTSASNNNNTDNGATVTASADHDPIVIVLLVE